jgi:predicted ATPase
MRELPAGTVTFLFTDVEGSTRLLHELGDEYVDALADHRRALRAAFDAHGGVEVDTQGDAFFVAFERASDALAAAEAGQRALHGRIRVRMGVHTGEPTVTDEGYVGMDVHRAARIAAAGHGGQILVSQSTRDLAAAGGLRDLGEHRLKDLAAPERIYQLGTDEFPPLKTLYQTNLPVPATPFVGREAELAAVASLLARTDVRLLSLVGPGGSGKTRLALQAAADAADGYPDGVWWVPLAQVSDPAAVLESAGRALGASGSLADDVGSKRLLLLLDNFEHVVTAAAELSALVADCPNLNVVVTSRERLHVAAEHLYPVPVLARPDARELFTARARAVQPAFVPDELLDELCARLDDLPLALELAAARTSLLTTGQLHERLGQRLDLLRGGRDADVRQQTLRATIEWSHDLLDATEQQLFRRLSVFAGGCTLEAAEMICEAEIETLQSLVDKSLVRVREDGRFWMLETVREFAAERLEASDDARTTLSAHANWIVALAESANLSDDTSGKRAQAELDTVLSEQANVRAAVDWAADADVELALRILVLLEQFWVTHAPHEGKRRLEAMLARADGVSAVVRGRAYRVLGGCGNYTGDHDGAELAYSRGREVFRQAGNERAAAVMTFRLGTNGLFRGEVGNARSLLEESLASFRRFGMRTSEGEAIGNLGTIELEHGDPVRGVELLEQSVAICREVGFVWFEAGKIRELARHALLSGDYEGGERRAREALALYRDVGGNQNIVYTLAALAWSAAARSDAARAGKLWGAIEAEELRERLDLWWEARPAYEARLRPVAGAAFDTARESGRLLTLKEAIDYALAADG